MKLFPFGMLVLILALPISNHIKPKIIENTPKTIHILVALCDNKYQGIVPVPPKIGNGQDPDNNLYWGCAYGIKNYFKKSGEWKFIKSEKQYGKTLERIIFRHISKDYYLVADAYDGREIKSCTKDFLNSNAGSLKKRLLPTVKTSASMAILT